MNDLHHFLNTITPITPETWNQVKELFTPLTLKKGAYFVEEGKKTIDFGFLQQGVIRAFYRNHEGIEYNKHFFTDKSMVGGFTSLVTQQPNKINQQALTDCTLLIGNYSKLVALLDEHQDLERLLRKIAENYFVKKEKREIEIVLLNATDRYTIFQKEYPTLEQLIPQYHIASFLGITPTQLSRIRNQIKK